MVVERGLNAEFASGTDYSFRGKLIHQLRRNDVKRLGQCILQNNRPLKLVIKIELGENATYV